MTVETLDCGHLPTSDAGCGTGYARTPKGETLCYVCADDAQRADMAKLGYADTQSEPFWAYLSADGRRVITWSGGTLATISLGTLTHTSSGFGGWRSDSGRWYFRAIDAEGREWHGTGPGPGAYCRLRLCKPKSAQVAHV